MYAVTMTRNEPCKQKAIWRVTGVVGFIDSNLLETLLRLRSWGVDIGFSSGPAGQFPSARPRGTVGTVLLCVKGQAACSSSPHDKADVTESDRGFMKARAFLTLTLRHGARVVALISALAIAAVWAAVAVLASRFRPRRPGGSGGEVCVVVPYPPGEKSGGSKAISGLLETLRLGYRTKVVPLYALPQPGSRMRRTLAEWYTYALPMPSHCRPFLLSPSAIASQVPGHTPVIVEFISGSLFLYFGRRPSRRLVIRDHEPLTLRLLTEMRALRGLERWMTALKAAVAYCFTARLYAAADEIVTLTAEDASFITGSFPFLKAPVRCIPVSISENGKRATVQAAVRPHELLFVANFYHRPNIDALLWFLRECATRLEHGYTLHICGLDEPLNAIALPATPMAVRRHGFVEDLDESLPGVSIAVAPVVSGAGVRMKNLVMAQRRKAIVTTPLGNQGIDFADGAEAMVCDTGADMADAIRKLSRSPALILGLGERAYQKVMAEFGPERALAQYRLLLEQ